MRMAVAAFLVLTSGLNAYADCNLSKQRTADDLFARLSRAAAKPATLSLQERICLVDVVGQILGKIPQDLTKSTGDLRAEIIAILPPGQDPKSSLSAKTLFLDLKTQLQLKCTEEIRKVPSTQLKPQTASSCGIVRLPGSPAGLGRITAMFESGSSEGGYDTISGDPGAGGWTYGKYQLASDVGGIDNFLKRLSCHEAGNCLPAEFKPLADKLVAAGGSQAAQEKSADFERTWLDLSRNDRLMQQAQESYQALVIWEPMKLFFSSEFSLDLAEATCGLREASFSILTQHKTSSAKQIFRQAVKVAGKDDNAAIVREANKWRLSKLGVPNGYYSTYGQICSGAKPPSASVTVAYACAYIKGVRERWTNEGARLAALNNKACP